MEKVYLILGASSDLGCALIRKIIQTEEVENLTVIAHYHSSDAILDDICYEFSTFKIILYILFIYKLFCTNLVFFLW